jgi:hypothetical protein
MKKNYQLLWGLFLLITALPFLYGCPGRGSNITLKVTDCPKDSIRIVFSDSNIVVVGPKKIVKANVTIFCGSNVAPNAEVMVDFPWLPKASFTPYKQQTDTNGQLGVNKDLVGDPSGKNLEITIQGNDGAKTVTMIIPPIPPQ